MKEAGGKPELNAGLGLLPRIEAHIRQLSPHMMRREGVLLLQEAMEEIKLLRNMGGPEFSDGHDCEGFIGGCERFGCPGGANCTELPNLNLRKT